jgi:hypothetical protein
MRTVTCGHVWRLVRGPLHRRHSLRRTYLLEDARGQRGDGILERIAHNEQLGQPLAHEVGQRPREVLGIRGQERLLRCRVRCDHVAYTHEPGMPRVCARV